MSIELPQFQKYIPDRSNAKHLVLKEEERIIEILQDLKKSVARSIDKKLYKQAQRRAAAGRSRHISHGVIQY